MQDKTLNENENLNIFYDIVKCLIEVSKYSVDPNIQQEDSSLQTKSTMNNTIRENISQLIKKISNEEE